jgi:hypothetical protein
MKKISIIIIIIFMMFSSCSQPGTTEYRLTGNESNLPEELKGLRVYRVATGYGNFINVAVLNNNANSITYKVGKQSQSTVIVNSQTGRAIEVKEIISETDSIIVCKK